MAECELVGRSSALTPDRYQAVTRLFLDACELAAERRTAFVRQSCGDDDELRAELERMLAQDGQPLAISIDHLLSGLRPEALLPQTVAGANGVQPDVLTRPQLPGRYRIVRCIGEGGMGTVYLAEQDQPRREVALKVIRCGLASARTRRRFRREADILARLSHPGIAQIYEAGLAQRYLGYVDDALASARRMCQIIESSPRRLNFTDLLPRQSCSGRVWRSGSASIRRCGRKSPSTWAGSTGSWPG